MFSYNVAALFLVISIMEIFLILGFPLGELTMGGHISFWFSEKVVQMICYVFAGYFSLNTIMCLCSRSKKEKYIMTPMAFMVV